MNPIDGAILQDEIRKALNAIFKNGQVGRAETKIVLSAPLDNGMLQREPGIELEEGEKYNVSLDSGDYEAVCKSYSFDGENTFYYLGDIAMYYPDVFESTGESFLVAADEAFIIAMDTNRGGYIRVQSETIHPIDPKFLPGVCLPVVELTTVPTADNAELTDEENAKMEEVASLGLPIVVKFFVEEGVSYMGVFSILNVETIHFVYFDGAATTTLTKKTDNGKWIFGVSGV